MPLNILLAVVQFAVQWRVLGTDAILGQSLPTQIIGTVIAFFGLLGVAVFFIVNYRVFITPVRLRNRINELEHPVPVFSLTPRVGKARQYDERPHLMWADIEVANLSALPLSDVEVRVDDYVVERDWNETTGKRTSAYFEPREQFQLTWSLVNAEPNAPTSAIRGKGKRIVSVAYSDDDSGRRAYFAILNEQWSIPVTGPWNRRELQPLPGKVTIVVTSPDAPTLIADFYLECHQSALRPLAPDEPAPYATMTTVEEGKVVERRISPDMIIVGSSRFIADSPAHFEFTPWDDYWASRQSDPDTATHPS